MGAVKGTKISFTFRESNPRSELGGKKEEMKVEQEERENIKGKEENQENFLCYIIQLSRYSDWLRAGRPRGGSSDPGKAKNILFFTSSRPALGSTQPPIQWVPGALSQGIKWPRREADYSSPAINEVKKMWIYTSAPPYAFME
jgi:hypothetical protein